MTGNNSHPLISVLTPTYNRSALLKRAVSSVLNQTYANFEMIIVDNRSKDNTEQVVGSINDNRIKYIKLESNKSPAGARNIAIKSARGRYITLLDSDDEYLPRKLELQINEFQGLPKDVGIVYCGYFIVYEPDIIHETIPALFKGDVFNTLLRHNCMGSPTPLIKRECFDYCGLFDESLPSCNDWDMWIRISEKYKFDYIDMPLAKVYTHGNQISTNINSKIMSREMLFEKYRDLIRNEPQAESYLLQRLGFLYFMKNDPSSSLKYYLRSIAANPADPGAYLTLLTFLLAKKRHINRMKYTGMRESYNITVYF